MRRRRRSFFSVSCSLRRWAAEWPPSRRSRRAMQCSMSFGRFVNCSRKLAGASTRAPVPEQARRVEVPIAGQMLGSPDAPLTMVEFTDLECPFCRQFYATTFEQLKTAYIDTNKLRYVSRDFPLEAIHPLAVTAARAARCAGAQGRFWEMRHGILKNNVALTKEFFLSGAEALQLDRATIQVLCGRSQGVRGRDST